LRCGPRRGSVVPSPLIVNLFGCFVIAALMHAALTLGWSPTVRAAVTIGFIGGLTTYSSFNYETMRLFEESAPAIVRIFLGESDKWHHTPLARAILERLRADGFAGATVVCGVAGFGASSVIHASLIELSTDLPVVIEVVDDQAHIDRLLPILDEMITGGALVTMERVRVLKYAAGQRHTASRPGVE